ncbi:MAG: macro domain-containing protein [SAR324 cluster bacterium]|nr:macro domain-containing protein [SAR324 cluster bacterium]
MAKFWIDTVNITALKVEGLVHTANTGLTFSSGIGVDIYKRGGAQIEEECRRKGKQQLGNVVVTGGGDLHVDFIFHAVAMMYEHPDVRGFLYEITTKCLDEAKHLQLKSLVFPAFSCGRIKNPPDLICESMGAAFAEYDFSKTPFHSVGMALKKEFYHIGKSKITEEDSIWKYVCKGI